MAYAKKKKKQLIGTSLEITYRLILQLKQSLNAALILFLTIKQKKKIITEPDVLISHVLVMVRLYRSMH